MRFPLATRKLIRGFDAHIKAGLGGGADYVAATGTKLYAPCDGVITRQYYGRDGGNWLWFDAQGYSLQFAHLSEYRANLGAVKEGELIALTGNTGAVTSGPHLHVQIIKDGKRHDVDAWFNERIKEDDMSTDEVKELVWRILHHTWRTHHNHQFPDDNSIKREVNDYLAKYPADRWAFSELIERWWQEGEALRPVDDSAKKLTHAKDLAAQIQAL